jgi:hypothetical protein
MTLRRVADPRLLDSHCLLENSRGCFREIALFPILLFFRFALRFWHVESCRRSSLSNLACRPLPFDTLRHLTFEFENARAKNLGCDRRAQYSTLHCACGLKVDCVSRTSTGHARIIPLPKCRMIRHNPRHAAY